MALYFHWNSLEAVNNLISRKELNAGANFFSPSHEERAKRNKITAHSQKGS
jgi:hypothetical protein